MLITGFPSLKLHVAHFTASASRKKNYFLQNGRAETGFLNFYFKKILSFFLDEKIEMYVWKNFLVSILSNLNMDEKKSTKTEVLKLRLSY